MRTLYIGFAMIIVFVLVAFTNIAIVDSNTREQEIKTTLDNTVKDTLETLFINKLYTINDTDELMGDFITSLMLQQNANSITSVKLVGADKTQGIIYMEITETYKLSNGAEKTIKCDKAVVLEEYY